MSGFRCFMLSLLGSVVFFGTSVSPVFGSPASQAGASEKRLRKIELRIEALEDGDLIFENQESLFFIDLKGRIDLDAIYGSENSPSSSFNVRRARFGLITTFQERYKAKVIGAFDDGRASVKDVYLEAELKDFLKLRLGHFKVPIGFERIQDSRDVPFAERSISTNNLTSDRDIGIMMHGDVYNEVFSYGLGVFNGDGSSSGGDNDSQKEVMLRSELKLLALSGAEFFKNLKIGGGIAIGFGDEGPIHGGTLSTRGGLEFLTTNPAAEYDGWHIRSSLEVSHFVGPFSFMYEYLSSFQTEILLGSTPTTFTHNIVVGGHTISLAYNLTGETATFGALQPNSRFSLDDGTWGALQLATRISFISVDDMHFDADTDAGPLFIGATGATELDLALNWYLNENMVFKLNYNQTWLSDPVLHEGREVDGEKILTGVLSIVW